jgi:poly-gamma-glutamate synthesis protein (capsule biosynthesis protein)
MKRIQNRITKLREEENCDIIIVSLHWGREEQMTPDPWQIPYAKQVLDAGADMIWGHHPHVIQPIQFYQGKPILYSTGNFIFGTMSSVDPSTGIFQVTWKKTAEGVSMKQLQVIPCETQLNPVFQPFELTDDQARKAVWDELTFNREYKGFVNPPESFLENGIVKIEDILP